MTANGNKVLQRLGFKCSSFVPYDAQDQAEPYITSNEVCHGLFGTKMNSSCEVSKAGVRRLCRCERPGEFISLGLEGPDARRNGCREGGMQGGREGRTLGGEREAGKVDREGGGGGN
jgi:hypothetical protein